MANPGNDLVDYVAKLHQAGDQLSRNTRNTQDANNANADFVRRLIMSGGVIAAIKLLIGQHKELALLSNKDKNPFTNLLTARTASEIKSRLQEVKGHLEEVNREITRLQTKIRPGMPEDILKRVTEQITGKKRQAEGYEGEIEGLGKELAHTNLHTTLEQHLGLVQKIGAALLAIIGDQTIIRWYRFNEAVRATNVDLNQRIKLYTLANKQEIELGRNLNDTAAIYEVARRNGLIYGRTITPEFEKMVHLSLQAEDALGLQPNEIDEIYAASKQVAEPFRDALDAIADMNQQLGLSSEEAAKLYEQVAQLSFGFGLTGGAATGVTEEVAKLGLVLKRYGITDTQAAMRLVSRMATPGTSESYMFGGGPGLLADKSGAALEKTILSYAQFLGRFAPSPALVARAEGGDQAAQRNLNMILGNVLGPVAETLHLSLADAQMLLKTAQAIQSRTMPQITEGTNIESLADQQRQRSGQIWTRFFEQLHGIFVRGMMGLAPTVDMLSGWITKAHTWLGSLSDSTKEVIKYGGMAVVTLISVAGALELIATTGAIFTALKGAGVGKGIGGFFGATVIGKLIGGLFGANGFSWASYGGSALSSIASTLLEIISSALILIGPFLLLAMLTAMRKPEALLKDMLLNLGPKKTIELVKDFIRVENAIGNLGTRLKNFVTNIIDWVIDHIPGARAAINAQELKNAANAPWTGGAGHYSEWTGGAGVYGTPAWNSGINAAQAKHDDEVQMLNDQFDALVAQQGEKGVDQNELRRHMMLIIEKLDALGVTAKDHKDVVVKDINESKRNADYNRNKNREMQFLMRKDLYDESGEESVGWGMGAPSVLRNP